MRKEINFTRRAQYKSWILILPGVDILHLIALQSLKLTYSNICINVAAFSKINYKTESRRDEPLFYAAN